MGLFKIPEPLLYLPIPYLPGRPYRSPFGKKCRQEVEQPEKYPKPNTYIDPIYLPAPYKLGQV